MPVYSFTAPRWAGLDAWQIMPRISASPSDRAWTALPICGEPKNGGSSVE